MANKISIEFAAKGHPGVIKAVKALNKSLKIILKYKNKPVLVTGALSNVGMFIIFLLTNIGINVEAVTSKKKNNTILNNDKQINNDIKTKNYNSLVNSSPINSFLNPPRIVDLLVFGSFVDSENDNYKFK